MRQIDHYNRRHRAQALSDLTKGTPVSIKDNHSSSYGVVIIHADTPRSYLVERPQGVLRRNRQMLVVLPEDGNAPPTSVCASEADAHKERHIVQEPECSHFPILSNAGIPNLWYAYH